MRTLGILFLGLGLLALNACSTPIGYVKDPTGLPYHGGPSIASVHQEADPYTRSYQETLGELDAKRDWHNKANVKPKASHDDFFTGMQACGERQQVVVKVQRPADYNNFDYRNLFPDQRGFAAPVAKNSYIRVWLNEGAGVSQPKDIQSTSQLNEYLMGWQTYIALRAKNGLPAPSQVYSPNGPIKTTMVVQVMCNN